MRRFPEQLFRPFNDSAHKATGIDLENNEDAPWPQYSHYLAERGIRTAEMMKGVTSEHSVKGVIREGEVLRRADYLSGKLWCEPKHARSRIDHNVRQIAPRFGGELGEYPRTRTDVKNSPFPGDLTNNRSKTSSEFNRIYQRRKGLKNRSEIVERNHYPYYITY